MPWNVLIVEDSEPILCTLVGFLESEGIAEDQIDVAATGGEGVELARDRKPEIVLLDLEPPDMSGAEAVRRILEVNPGIFVTVTTTLGEDDPRVRAAIEQGASRVLKKPLRLSAVRRAIGLMEEERGARGRIPAPGSFGT